MIPLIEHHRQQIAALCRKYGIRKLDLFGSAVRGDFEAKRSDIDFLFEFDSDSTKLADRFFGFWEDLERLLGQKVDLVSGLDVHNPYFLQVANQQRVTLYAA